MDLHHSSASCSYHPGRGASSGKVALPSATELPISSQTTALVAVVEQSIPTTYRSAAMLDSPRVILTPTPFTVPLVPRRTIASRRFSLPAGVRARRTTLAKLISRHFGLNFGWGRWLSLRAAMFYEPGDVRMEDVPVPGPGEVLVRIGAALTCGMDVKTYKRGHPTLITEIPSPFGHEFEGTIETVGEGVEGWRPGTRVVAANSAPCNRCYYCKVGDQSMCENLAFLNGAFAEYIVVPERIVGQNLYEIPEGVAYSRAALLEPLACAVHGVVHTPISMGDTVAVIGAGQIGLMFVRLATERGARVVCIDRSSDRLAVARELGAEETIEAADGVDTIEAVRDWTPEGRGADRGIEAVGLPETWEQALQMVRKGGDVTLFGGAPSGTSFEVDTVLLHYSQITIRGIFHHTPYTVQVAFDLLKSGRLDPEPFISGVRPLEDVVEALEQHGRQEGIKYEIQPPDGGPS